MSESWHVYILRCRDNSLYTGITQDISRRLSEHAQQNHKTAKYLRNKGPFTLVFSQSVENRSAALKMESAIKKFSKKKKELLISACRDPS